MQKFPTLTSHGAAARVTGSKHLITTITGEKILLDCGLFQGEGKEGNELNRNWGFTPSEIDYVILSHAHIDHTGLLPKLVKDGFSGTIFSNSATRDLCEIMLADSAHIQESDLKRVNKRRLEKGLDALEPLYDLDDAMRALGMFQVVQDNHEFTVGQSTKALYIPNAHIIGSSAIRLKMVDLEGKTITLTFTGDIGRPNDQILAGPFPFPQSDYIISESTYGDRVHEEMADAKEAFYQLIHRICVEKHGKIIIPAFSIDRTQEIIYILDQLAFEKRLPHIPVYVDSPLSIKATQIMSLHREEFNPEILEYITKDGDPFSFPSLHYVSKVEDSKAINDIHSAAIIISASGMAEAGRIKHHIANNIENPLNAILIVGYATPFSLAGQLTAGNQEVKIFGEKYQVFAEIHRMNNFSAHADWKEMIQYLSCQDASKVKKVFLVHGEEDTLGTFKSHIMDAGFKNVQIVDQGVEYSLS